MAGTLEGKVALVTGAARGIGLAIASRFAREGANVMATDMLDGTCGDARDGRMEFRRHDVTDEAAWTRIVQNTVALFGRIDILVNNAGILCFNAIEDTTRAEIDQVLAVNVVGPILGVKTVGVEMKKQRGGAIINISSIDGMKGCNGLAVYTASKWAVRGFTKSAALEYGHHGIRVNSVHPGSIDTAMGNPSGFSRDQIDKAMDAVPLQRIGVPDEVAGACLFLASDAAAYTSGAELAVDGGWSAGFYQPMLPGAPAPRTD